MKIPISKGKFTTVDAEDFEELTKHKWQYIKGGYVARGEPRPLLGKIMMHRQILSAPRGLEVDHINGNPLDNRRANLRLCTHSLNAANKFKYKGTSSRYKGVVKVGNRWVAQINSIYLGSYKTEEAAAKAYNQSAAEYYKEYARLNSVL